MQQANDAEIFERAALSDHLRTARAVPMVVEDEQVGPFPQNVSAGKIIVRYVVDYHP